MDESKIELTERLRQEGRWGEASRFKDTVVAECRTKGMRRGEAGEAAWEALEKAYPPLPVEDDDESLDGLDDGDDALDEGADAVADDTVEATPDLVRDVLWVYDNLGVTGITPRDAPGPGAWGLLQYARKYKKPFYENLFVKAMAARAKDQDQSAVLKRYDKQVEEIREIIGQFSEAQP